MGPTLRNAATGCAISFALILTFFLFQIHPEVGQRLLGTHEKPPDQEEPPEPEFFPWHTRSQFRPVKQPVGHKAVQDLCDAFPKHLLRDIQPVLRTGHAVLDARVTPQLQSVSACLDDHLLIFSDVDEEFHDYQIIDVVADLPTNFTQDNEQLGGYMIQREMARNGTLGPGNSAHIKGWELDKFKFLPQVSRVWHLRPEKRWYVFYEGDTYLVWDNIFRLLANFDPDMPWYFGSPSPGAEGSWMANGGPGYVLSREAIRRLVRNDSNSDGVFVGSKLSERWEHQMMADCCGDSILGWALHEDAKTNLSGLWPMFQPHPLQGIPFSDLYWCQPVISMHKTSSKDMVELRRWEESRRESQRPLLFADLAEYLNLSKVAKREDWINSDWDGYSVPAESAAHDSFDACGKACKADPGCFQWTYHLRACRFTRSIRLGRARSPEVEDSRSEEEKAFPWTNNDKRFTAGWDLIAIRRWMNNVERDCNTVQWVRPSLERIF